MKHRHQADRRRTLKALATLFATPALPAVLMLPVCVLSGVAFTLLGAALHRAMGGAAGRRAR